MQELQTGSWYRLIGGEQVRVVRVDVEPGIANVSDPGGQVSDTIVSGYHGSTDIVSIPAVPFRPSRIR